MADERNLYSLEVSSHEWFRPFNHYDRIPYTISDSDMRKKEVLTIVRGKWQTVLESLWYRNKTDHSRALAGFYFDGREERIVQSTEVIGREQFDELRIVQIDRFYPPVTPYSAKLLDAWPLRFRFPTGTVLEQTTGHWWHNSANGHLFINILVPEVQLILGQVEAMFGRD